MTGAQNNLSENILKKMINIKTNNGRREYLGSSDLLRQMLGFIGRGNINGQEVRDGILHVMHKNHIGECNAHFYEQWHQKLHNNTTPDDIYICQAVIKFLETNDIQKYWNILNHNGITKERLASFERKIVVEPFYEPKLIPDLKWYLDILKKVHSSINLNGTIACAIPKLSSDMQSGIR